MKFTSTTALVTTALLASSVFAGLEDAKFSTKLTPENFNKSIAKQSKGTLVAFFATWCGHCKSLEPVWTKVAGAFENDDRCKLGHLEADAATAKPLAEKYGVSGFPTLKFIPSGGGNAIDYNGGRTEEALLEFMNEHCGTSKLPGGEIGPDAGRIPTLDSLASVFFGTKVNRAALLEQAKEFAGKESDALAQYYVKIMNRFVDGKKNANEWIEKEMTRLANLASKKGSVAGKKLDELKMKQNILGVFKYVGDAAEAAAEEAEAAIAQVVEAAQDAAAAVGEKVEEVVERMKDEL